MVGFKPSRSVRLRFDAAQRRAFFLGLDHAQRLAVDEEQVVGEAGL